MQNLQQLRNNVHVAHESFEDYPKKLRYLFGIDVINKTSIEGYCFRSNVKRKT
jgi:hypothetical protein